MRRLLWPTAAVLLAAGCGSASGGEAPVPDPRPLGRAADFTAAERTVLHHAEEAAVQRCMERRGFAYRPVPAADFRRSAESSPYGLLTSDRAAQDGYGMTGGLLQGQPPDPNATVRAALPEQERRQWQRALRGSRTEGPKQVIDVPGGPTVRVPADSCVQEATEEVYGKGWDERYLLVQGLRNRVVKKAMADDGVREAVARWADCMKKEGHAFRELQDGPRAVQRALDRAEKQGGRAALQKAGRTELRLARLDAGCQRSAKLAEAVDAAQTAVERALPTADRSALSAFRTARDQALAKARRAMKGRASASTP
ncbi:hypothetical protein G3I32_24925 [Streptomyces coelicoflavus]|uniref:Lipoprotein n=1 Tax=Streptomyces coelicoflavus TaxID=285562 RepID=A0A7K3PQD0_9ACTN|nr:hypothetical protein [Streptomyces coelicoflavus]NEB12047.1 hypothetical protein [Streptomyces coelicoflavus]